MADPIADNLLRIRDRVAQAAARSGRAAEAITLVAVTKRQPLAALTAVLAAGVRDIGENFVQEAAEKKAQLAGSGARWHLLGHLQSNKARPALDTFDLIQSVDSEELAQRLGRLGRLAGDAGKDILLQLHLGDEPTKSGAEPGQAAETAARIGELPGVRLRGLMGIAPLGEDPRPHFRRLRTLFDALDPGHRQILSMGMTGDFETAIEEGATMVRIGTAIFGPRRATPGPG